MSYNLKENLQREERFAAGHRMCAGCGSPIAKIGRASCRERV